MSVFTKDQRQYLLSGVRLGRLATIGSDGTPHVVPTAFHYNPDHDTIDIGGHDFAKRKKYRDVLRNPKVAFVVDDIASVNPWRVRGIEVRGEAEVLDTGGTELMHRRVLRSGWAPAARTQPLNISAADPSAHQQESERGGPLATCQCSYVVSACGCPIQSV